MIRTLALVCAVLAATPQLTGAWRVDPLVEPGVVPSDMPDVQIQELGEAWVRPVSREVVFWGKTRDQRKGWALFSWRDGKVRTIAAEGDVRPRSAGLPEPPPIRRSWGASAASLTFNGKAFYIFTYGGGRTAKPVLYGWDGEQLRVVLKVGESLSIGGTPNTVGWLFGPRLAEDGTLLVRVDVAKPEKQQTLVAFDGLTAHVLLATGQALAHAPDRQIMEIGCSPDRVNDFVPLPNLAAAGCVETRGADKRTSREAIYVDRSRTRTYLRTGDPYPGEPAAKIAAVRVFAAPDHNRAGVLIRRSRTGADEPVMVAGETVAPIELRLSRTADSVPTAAHYASDNANALYMVTTTRPGTVAERTITLHATYGRNDLFWCKDLACTRVTPATILFDDSSTVRPAPAGFAGYVIHARHTEAGMFSAKPPEDVARWTFDPSHPDLGLQPAPEVARTPAGEVIDLVDVHDGFAEGELIAIEKGGIYRLRRVE